MVRSHRENAGLTQRELAEGAGIGLAALQDLEQGRTIRPRPRSLARLAAFLQLSIDEVEDLIHESAGAVDGRQGGPLGREHGYGGDEPGHDRTGLRVRILGPLAAWRDGRPIALGPARQRAVLALLALYMETGLSRATIVDALWGDDPPATAGAMVQAQISRIRRLLGSDRTPGDRAVLSWTGSVYQLGPGSIRLDRAEFSTSAEDARHAAAAGQTVAACELYERALGLWRGQPLEDIDVLRGHAAVTALSRQRDAVVIEFAAAATSAGLQDQAISHVEALTAREPLDERAHAHLMLSLAATGRQAAALRVYQELSERLDAELGVRPGPELSAAHLQVLRQQVAGPAGAAETATVPSDSGAGVSSPRGRAEPSRERAETGGVVPRQLPAAVGSFTGRDTELAALTGLLDAQPGTRPPAMVISAIGGTAGVGKTALAVHWAHQVAERFRDGQLYVNLRGYDPGQPVPAADALAAFLRSLGVPGQDIPQEADERAARYRSLLAGKRVLIVLDNAESAGQVRPLLPGTPACTVVVTSRDALAGLVAGEGAARLDLDLLPLAEAVALLETLIGPRAEADPMAAAELADLCCRLPLALRVAAELAAGRPAASLAGLAGELADLRTRLDLLGAGEDPRTQVRAVFSWSCRHLDVDAARAFRLAGLHPGPDLEPYAVAALTGAALPQARRVLEVLARAHLMSPAGPGRYGMHDLLRAYARELSATVDSAQEQHAALTRLFDHYLHTTAAAMDTLFPAMSHVRPRIPRPCTPVPPLPGPAAARQWLDDERPALVAAAAHTAAHGWPGHATRLAITLSSYLIDGGHIADAVTVFGHALGAARRTGDRAAEAATLNLIGNVELEQGRYQQAGDHYRQALALYRAAGDRAGEARPLGNIGIVEMELGRCEQAARYQQEAAAIFRDIGDRLGEARALGNLGEARHLQGRYQEAADYCQRCVDLSREVGDRLGEAWALASLGIADLRLGRGQHAARCLERAIAVLREMGDRRGEAESLVRLGEVYLGLGRYEHAAGNFEQALAISREISHRVVEAEALNGLGDVFFRAGKAGKARAHHAAALRLASEAGAPLEQARAHSGLARACQADGNAPQARHHWQQALTRYAAIGAPEACEIRDHLAMAGDRDDDDHEPTETKSHGVIITE
jgi:DNA-binding SARP family transcriptional activator/tetratricopeptide (TPR) repeat protein/DNA-binding XRE family transcriptional regulator